MKCQCCDSENIKLLKHIFINKEEHVKQVCFNCYYTTHIPRVFMNLVSGEYTIDTWAFFKVNRKKYLKDLRKKALAKIKSIETPIKVMKPKKNKNKTNKKDFYLSSEWEELRYNTLKKHGRKCMVCFRTNLELHVDHIKPRSRYPELELEASNLQVLCRDCNKGKSNTDSIDWRPDVT